MIADKSVNHKFMQTNTVYITIMVCIMSNNYCISYRSYDDVHLGNFDPEWQNIFTLLWLMYFSHESN
jgi:hypothetical protein